MKSIVNTPLINGFEYNYGNITVLINGVLPTIGITAIDYKETVAMENLYGAGNMPIARGVSNYTYEASLTLYKSELIALQRAARTQDPLNVTGAISNILPFDILVSYARADKSGITTDILKNVQFLENSVSSAQGDSSILIQIPLILSHIQWGA